MGKRPFRKHLAMERCKHFVDVSWKGFAVRSNIKLFVKTAHLLQAIFRLSHQILYLVKVHIFEPHVWAAETLFLATDLDVPEEVMRARVAKHIADANIEAWREKKKRLMEERAVLLVTAGTKQQFKPPGRPSS